MLNIFNENSSTHANRGSRRLKCTVVQASKRPTRFINADTKYRAELQMIFPLAKCNSLTELQHDTVRENHSSHLCMRSILGKIVFWKVVISQK